MGEKQLNKNDVIFRQGDWGSEFFQILEDKVKVYYDLGEGNSLFLSELQPGDFLGEMAIIENYPRSDSAIALEDGTKLLVVSPEETGEYLEANPEKALQLMDHIGNRIRTLTKDYEEAKGILDLLEKGQAESDNESIVGKLKKHLAYGKAVRNFGIR